MNTNCRHMFATPAQLFHWGGQVCTSLESKYSQVRCNRMDALSFYQKNYESTKPTPWFLVPVPRWAPWHTILKSTRRSVGLCPTWVWELCWPHTSFKWKGLEANKGKLKWEKIIQSIPRLLQEHPRSELWNQPSSDSLELPSPNPFMASLFPDLIQRLAIKGFGDGSSRLLSGGSSSILLGRSGSSLEIDWIFSHFYFPESAVWCPILHLS